MLRGVPVFELNLWCGTCPAMFHKLNATQQADLEVANELLNAGLDSVSADVVGAYGKVLPESTYTLLLTDVLPRLTEPGGKNDYFVHEQVATWGVDPAVGTPEDPGTPYYRTFETPVDTNGHLYEILVPMVPPSWNNDDRVEQYAATASGAATAVAYSLLDVLQPAMDEGDDYYQHFVLTHFLLDGHHKVEAATRTQTSIRLLSFVDERISLATPEEMAAATHSLSLPQQARNPHR